MLERNAHLDIQLRKGHIPTIRNTNEETASIETSQTRCGHHDYVRDAAKGRCHPEALPAAHLGGEDAGRARAQECAKRHERGDQLLSLWRDVVACW